MSFDFSSETKSRWFYKWSHCSICVFYKWISAILYSNSHLGYTRRGVFFSSFSESKVSIWQVWNNNNKFSIKQSLLPSFTIEIISLLRSIRFFEEKEWMNKPLNFYCLLICTNENSSLEFNCICRLDFQPSVHSSILNTTIC